MKKRLLCMLLVASMVMGFLPGFPAAANAAGTPKTAKEAAAEMTWGVNLADLYMAEPEIGRHTGYQTGYDDYVAKEYYDMTVAAWFWDGSFQWISTYPTEKQDTIQISLPLPDYDAAVAEANKDWAFLTIRCGDKTGGKNYKVTLSDCQIVAANGTVLKGAQDFGANGDGVLTMEGTTSSEPDINNWHWGYATAENNWTDEIAYFAGEWNEATQRMESGADPKYNGATFTATLTVDTASMLPVESKTEYYYCVNRYESDYRTLVDTYMAQGVDVFRLPVTWTWFTRNDGDFAIDEEWLEAVKGTVDYILSKGAYCILNTHDDYLQYSFVAESDGNGGYTNFRWEDQWMEDPYKDYVDARFVAIWTQIAEYFKDCSDHLIFESMNEPSMLWYSGVDFDNWLIRQNNRINGMNRLFVDTVRATGGNNATRILCLPTNNYCTHTWLDDLVIPEASDYMMVQIHSYAHVVDNEWDDPDTMDALFSNAAAFQTANPKVALIVGEAGISHSLANRADPEGVAAQTEAFVGRAADNGMPCLWWEDYFPVYDGFEADQTHWLYDKGNDTWRENVLTAIKTALNITDVPTDPEETEPEDTEPEVVASGSCGENLTWTLDSEGTLTISGTGAMEDYNGEVEAPWVAHRDEILSVVVEAGVTDIGDYAFYNCKSLSIIVIPEGVTDIGSGAFYICTSLNNVTIPEGVTDIGFGAFQNCTSLSSITLPDSLTGIDNWAFHKCTSLRSIEIPENVTAIGTGAFYGCTNLESITIPEGVTGISDTLFFGCKSLTGVTLPEGVTGIGVDAFYGCESLSSITIPEGVAAISDNAFSNCTGLTDIILPVSVTTIGMGTFNECKNLTTVHYAGTEAQKAGIEIDITTNALGVKSNGYLVDATWHYECTGTNCPETPPVEETKPEETKPEETKPEETKPQETKPEETKPEETKPEETKPEDKPQVPECDKNASCTLSQFADIKVDDWYHDGIHFCVENKIMNGMGEGVFAPNEPTTRAQLVTMLYRLEGEPTIEGKTEPFADVAETDWFYAPIVWAYNNKVVNGISDTEFAPNANVTREQVATILYRFLESPEGTGKLDEFPDVAKVSDYAKDALTWAVGAKLITGVAQPDGTTLLDPAGNATRAQIATILMRHLTA